MPFVKGQVTNPRGRRKGSQNKINGKTREIFQLIVEANHEQLKEDIASLEPRDRVRAIIDLTQYFLPKMSVAQVEANVQSETRISIYDQLAEMARADGSRAIEGSGASNAFLLPAESNVAD